jgi:hypothetical protein
MVLLEANTRDGLLTGSLELHGLTTVPNHGKIHWKVYHSFNFTFPLNGTPSKMILFATMRMSIHNDELQTSKSV